MAKRYPNNIAEKINELADFAKDTRQRFPTFNQEMQQSYSGHIVQTGLNKQSGFIRSYDDYLKYGEKVSKKFTPMTEEEYNEKLKDIWDDLKGYRSKSAITKNQYKYDEITVNTMTDGNFLDGLDFENYTKKERREILKEAYELYKNSPDKGSLKYGYFEAVVELLERDLYERQ